MLKKSELPGQRKLTPKQAQFVAMLLNGVSIKQAAKQVEVSERTAHTWLALAQIKQELAVGTEAILSSGRLRADVLGAQAISVLGTLMLDTTTPPAVRVQAARALAARLLDAVPAQAETAAAPGIDWSQFSPEQLEIIAPVFASVDREQQEKKQA